jgi:acetyltransferase
MVLLRPIKTEDELLWLEMFSNLSEESIRYRFFQIIKDIPLRMAIRYCNIDYDRETAVVAELTEDEERKIIGVTRVLMDPDRKMGEISVIVADPWQGLGLGSKLIDFLIKICEDTKLETICGLILSDNYRAINLLKKMGFKIKYLDDGTVKALLTQKKNQGKSQLTHEDSFIQATCYIALNSFLSGISRARDPKPNLNPTHTRQLFSLLDDGTRAQH